MAQAILSPPTLLELQVDNDPDLLFLRLSYVVDKVLDFSTPWDTAVFYSGRNKKFAERYAVSKGKFTIEMTPGGKYLDGLDLFNFSSIYKDGPPLPGKRAAEIWDQASGKFASLARGKVKVFIHNVNPINEFGNLRTFFRVELPIFLSPYTEVNEVLFKHNNGEDIFADMHFANFKQPTKTPL